MGHAAEELEFRDAHVSRHIDIVGVVKGESGHAVDVCRFQSGIVDGRLQRGDLRCEFSLPSFYASPDGAHVGLELLDLLVERPVAILGDPLEFQLLMRSELVPDQPESTER